AIHEIYTLSLHDALPIFTLTLRFQVHALVIHKLANSGTNAQRGHHHPGLVSVVLNKRYKRHNDIIANPGRRKQDILDIVLLHHARPKTFPTSVLCDLALIPPFQLISYFFLDGTTLSV